MIALKEMPSRWDFAGGEFAPRAGQHAKDVTDTKSDNEVSGRSLQVRAGTHIRGQTCTRCSVSCLHDASQDQQGKAMGSGWIRRGMED